MSPVEEYWPPHMAGPDVDLTKSYQTDPDEIIGSIVDLTGPGPMPPVRTADAPGGRLRLPAGLGKMLGCGPLRWSDLTAFGREKAIALCRADSLLVLASTCWHDRAQAGVVYEAARVAWRDWRDTLSRRGVDVSDSSPELPTLEETLRTEAVLLGTPWAQLASAIPARMPNVALFRELWEWLTEPAGPLDPANDPFRLVPDEFRHEPMDWGRWFLVKLLALLGLTDLKDLLEDVFHALSADLRSVWGLLARGDVGAAMRRFVSAIERLLEEPVATHGSRVAARYGAQRWAVAEALQKVLKSLAKYALPAIGWGLLLAELLALMFSQGFQPSGGIAPIKGGTQVDPHGRVTHA